MTEKEKMLNEKMYECNDEELVLLRQKCHRLCLEYNNTLETEEEKRTNILKDMGVKMDKNVYLQGPIYFDYGCFITFGENSYANFNLTVLDTGYVNIGKNVFIGPSVNIVTSMHPIRYQDRNLFRSEKGYITDREYGLPITIEDNCWIGTNVTICGGVTIGSGSVIGANSVVTKSIPKNSLAVGNPCKVIREITDKDKIDEKYL